MDYKHEFGITLTEAKRLAKNELGRLPRPGHEICVTYGYVYVKFDGLNHDYKVYLVNQSGKFYLRKWVDVNPRKSD